MKRAVVLLCLVMILSLSGCGAQEAASLSPSPDARDYEGTYHNGSDEEYDSIDITRNDDGSYDFTISIYGLCEMKGIGNDMDGAVETTLTDSDGAELTAIFFPDENGTYTFRVTTSMGDYLEEGTDVAGFELIQ